MTKEQITQWLNAHSSEKRQYTYFTGDHYKLTFANGETYEHERKNIDANDFIATISINGAIASKKIMREGWLPSGAWGVYELKNLTHWSGHGNPINLDEGALKVLIAYYEAQEADHV